ncbi:hypothetical protein EST38_g5645 [Candolleomyces aberdarensis]|uniref:Uncharacterized protein n=1 Tax=Candolleomyces aberdarensis TaxID=2316362 RepID=A0A4Q2DJU8_9AGAR|nr:hypothetical protein EST38_g5645 [Candolleomyces aberdarensis]
MRFQTISAILSTVALIGLSFFAQPCNAAPTEDVGRDKSKPGADLNWLWAGDNEA